MYSLLKRCSLCFQGTRQRSGCLNVEERVFEVVQLFPGFIAPVFLLVKL